MYDIPLRAVIRHRNEELYNVFFEYANNNNIIIDVNKTVNNECPLYEAILRSDIKYIKLLIEYAEKHNMILNLNLKGFCNIIYQYSSRCDDKRMEEVKLLINYAKKYNMKLKIDESIVDICEIFKNYKLIEIIKNNKDSFEYVDNCLF